MADTVICQTLFSSFLIDPRLGVGGQNHDPFHWRLNDCSKLIRRLSIHLPPLAPSAGFTAGEGTREKMAAFGASVVQTRNEKVPGGATPFSCFLALNGEVMAGA